MRSSVWHVLLLGRELALSKNLSCAGTWAGITSVPDIRMCCQDFSGLTAQVDAVRAFAVQQVEDLAARHFSQARGQAVATAGASHQGPLLHPQGLPAAWQEWQARSRRQAATTARTTVSAATARDPQPLQPWQQAVAQAVLQLEGQVLQGFLQLMSGAQPARGEARLAATSPMRAAGLKPWPSAGQASPEDLARELTGAASSPLPGRCCQPVPVPDDGSTACTVSNTRDCLPVRLCQLNLPGKVGHGQKHGCRPSFLDG